MPFRLTVLALLVASGTDLVSSETPARPTGVPRAAVLLSDRSDTSPNTPLVWVDCVLSTDPRAHYVCSFYAPKSGSLLSRRPFTLTRPLPDTRREGATPGYVPGPPARPKKLLLRGISGSSLLAQPPLILVPVSAPPSLPGPTPRPTPPPPVA